MTAKELVLERASKWTEAQATAALRVVEAQGELETVDCHFEYGVTQALGSSVPCAEGNSFAGSEDHPVSAGIPVTKGTWYYYRLSASNGNGRVSLSGPGKFIPQGKPIMGPFTGVDRINTDGARLIAEFDPNGGNASYHFEWGEEGSFESSTPESDTFGFTSDPEVGDNFEPGIKEVANLITGLSPGTTYQFRVVVTNEAGSVTSDTFKFRTYVPDPGVDPCPNSHVRQQTEASLLADCRAYELVSATDTGGYDVVSDIVAGQAPLPAYPRATDSLIYSVRFGVIPGVAGSPTNLGLDPYVARREGDGWATEYVGVPADGMADEGAFGSPLLGADPTLQQFAFGGPEICSPCFPDGSSNIPLRLASGTLVKGMAGSLNPAADPAGEVRMHFSDDGSHFVFGSEERFELSGNDGSVTIYDRNLSSGTTQVASTMPDGTTMTGEVAQLDISSDGSRILIGKLVGTDSAGNEYFDLYMHVGANPNSVSVADTSSGVLYNGMTGDGAKVFFTTPDPLAGDGDTSPDLFRADVGASSATVAHVSTGTGGTGDTDECVPVGNWNLVSGGPNCGTVAIAGGGGVASGDGTVYFFSPERLDGGEKGIQGQPNLYAVIPGGAPRFVATLETDHPAIQRGLEDSELHSFDDFQVTPDGDFAVLSSKLALTDFDNLGFSEIYRYDTSGDVIDCPSCAPTGAAPSSHMSLSKYGSNLSDDGRVFYTTRESFTLRDTNEKLDAYQWSEGAIQLISAGVGQDDSGLVTVSADGRNAFFYTRDTLVPEDVNGSVVKIYVARAGGGVEVDPPRLPCAASDECHGPGTQQPPPPSIASVVDRVSRVPQGRKKRKCRRGFVKKRGKCVKRKRTRKKHSKHRRVRRRG